MATTNNAADYSPTQFNIQGGGANGTLVNISPSVTSGVPLISQGSSANPIFGTAVVAGGGTGAVTLTSNGVLLGNGTSPVSATTAGTTGQVLTGVTGSAPTFQTPAASSITITGDSGGGLTGNSFTFTGGTTGLTFAGAGTTETVGGTLVVSNGGTGRATLTNHGVFVGAGTAAITQLSVGTNGQVLIGSTAADPVFANLTSSGSTITFTTGAGTLNLETASKVAVSFATGSGTATPASGVITIAGTTNQITTTGSGSTVTIAVPSSPSFGGTTTVATGLTATTGAITATSGNVVITNGNLTLPATSSTVGQIVLNGVKIFHAFGTQNIFIGPGVQAGNFTLTTGTSLANVGIGAASLASLTSGSRNTALGSSSLTSCTSGTGNFAGSVASLVLCTSGSNNVAIGFNSSTNGAALEALLTGSQNVGIGIDAGINYTSSESNNILLVNSGTVSESNVMRLGTTGSGTGQVNKCFIAGIFGVTVGVSGVPVVVDNTGNFGTVVSSERFKDNIEDMADTPVLDLQPVNFTYKSDKTNALQYGLIAEDVAEVFPDLVVYDDEGEPHSVKYQNLPVLLLHEMKKLRQRVEALEAILDKE